MAKWLKSLAKTLKKRRVKILLVFLVATLIILPILSSIAQAVEPTATTTPDGFGKAGWGFIADVTAGPLLNGFNTLLYGILYLSGYFLQLSGHALDAVLDPALYNFMEEGIVQEGWTIVRDVCNLFFILILLIIAFATILRLETYDIKRMLPKLLVIALLINFSKMICGLIIDFSQILMNTFLHAMAGENFSTFAGDITKIMENVRLLGTGSFWQKAAQVFTLNVGVTAQLGMNISFFLVMGIILLILTVLLLIRIVALWILIILAPLAWLIGIIPTGKKFADQWWENFIKYCFFGPVMAFFLYLSWKSFARLKEFMEAPEALDTVSSSNFFTYITVMILLIASAVAAKSMGVAGAGFMISGAKRLALGKKGKGGLIRRAGGWGVTGAAMGTAAGGALMRKVFKKWPRAAEIKKGIVEKAERAPIIGRPLGGPGAYTARQRAEINKRTKEYADRPTEDVRRIAGQFAPTKEALYQSAGAIKLLSQRPEGFTDEDRKLVERYKRSGGKTSDIYARRPDWAKEPGKEIGKMIPEEAKNIQREALKDEKVITAIRESLKEGGTWTKEHLAQMGKRGDLAERVKQEVVIKHKGELSPQVQLWLGSDVGKSVYGTKEEVEEVIGRRKKKKIVSGTEPEFRKAKEEKET